MPITSPSAASTIADDIGLSSCGCEADSCPCSVSGASASLADADAPDDGVLHALTPEQHWVLWHHRLGHLHSQRMNAAQWYALALQWP